MSLNFIFFITFYFIAIFSTIGFGLIFEKLFKIHSYKLNLGFTGLTGVLFLITYSYISHFFFPHGNLHNLILIIIGLIAFFFLISNKKKEEIILFLIIFFVLFSGFLLFKTHDDFPYYHFPYTYYLTQNSMIIGIGQFNHGFRTPSSSFYINSLFYLPFIKYYMFNLFAVLIMGFANVVLINKILIFLKNKKIDYIFYLSLLFIIFINIFFYRIQEHGTDHQM